MAEPRPDPQPDPAPRVRRPLDGRKVTVRFMGVVTRVPRYMRLGWLLLRDPRIPTRGKAALAGALGYAISPIDPLPGIIPIIGQLDDLAILMLGIRSALTSAPPDVADEHLAQTGLSLAAIERDLTTVRATAIWLAERGSALAARAARAVLGDALERVGRALAAARQLRVSDLGGPAGTADPPAPGPRALPRRAT